MSGLRLAHKEFKEMTQVRVRSMSFPRNRTIVAPRCQLNMCKSPLTNQLRARKGVIAKSRMNLNESSDGEEGRSTIKH